MCKHKHLDQRSLQTNATTKKKLTLEAEKYISKIVLTTTSNPSTSSNMKTTQLFEEYWAIKRNYFTPKVTWRIIRKCAPLHTCTRK